MGAGIVLYSLYDTATPIAFDRSIASLDPDMRSPMLPPEVSEQWIDYLRDDRATLKACSLTCREWAPPTRRYLLEHVKVQSAPGWLRFLKTLQRSPEIGTDIGQYIHRLEFMDISIGPRVQDLFLDIVRHAGISRMPNVRELILREWNWATMVDRALDYSPTSAAEHVFSTLLSFPQVRTVTLVNNVVRYPHIIPHLLATFSSLTTLHVKCLSFTEDALHADHLPFQWRARGAIPLVLREVSLYYPQGSSHHVAAANFLLKALLTRPPFRLSVHTFRIEAPERSAREEETAASVLDVLWNIRRSCEHLYITSACE